MSQKCSKIKLISKGLICINSIFLSSQVLAAENLEQAWDIALGRNHQIAAAQQKERAANAQVQAAKSNYLPKVTLDGGYLRLESEPAASFSVPGVPFLKNLSLPFAQDSSYFGAVSVTAPLFTGGRISQGVAAANSLSEASSARTQLTRSEQKLAVAQTYLNVLRTEHAQAVAASYAEAVARHVSDVQQLFKQGYVARHDLLASETAQSSAQLMLLRAANALELARADYNRWMGRSFSEKVDITDIAVNGGSRQKPGGDLNQLMQAAMNQRQELQELGKQGQALRQQADSVRAGHLPQIGLNAGYGKLENRYLAEDKGWWVGIVMKWDLFDGGAIRHQASQLAANAGAVAEMEQDARERISLQVRQAWLNYNEALARIDVAQRTLAQSEETLKLARERYRAAMGPNSEVLDAESSYRQAQSERDNAQYDREYAWLQLQFAAGQL